MTTRNAVLPVLPPSVAIVEHRLTFRPFTRIALLLAAQMVAASVSLGAQVQPNVSATVERAQRRSEAALARAAQIRERALAAQAQSTEREQERERLRQLRQRQQRMRERLRESLARRRGESRQQGPGYTESLTRRLKLRRGGTLELTNTAGDVRVSGTRGDDVRIDAVKHVWAANEPQARAQLQEVQVRITERGDVVDVRTDMPRRRDLNAAVDYTVSVPTSASVVLRAVSGDVTITNVRGELRVDTISGHVTASSLGARSLIKGISGAIDISDTEGTELTVSTVSGAVTLRDLKVRTLDVTSVSGQVRLDVESERVRARSLGGSIDYVGPLARSGRYELQSHSGRLQITPTTGSGFDVDAVTVSGQFRSDVPLTVAERLQQPRGGRGDRRVTGTVGDGSALVFLRSFSGEMVIGRR
jgi:hypothetical protein